MKSAAPAVTREHDEDETSGDSSGPPGRLRAAVWFIAAAASFLQAWANRFLISPDGNNYLDIATAYLRHDWGTAINGWWSPMFSWILAAILASGQVTGRWETPVMHFLNGLALLFSLWCFEFFAGALRRSSPLRESAGALSRYWWLLVYAVFLSTSLFVLTTDNTTPDIWVAAICYLTSGILVRIRNGASGRTIFAVLGIVLGVGYLFKQIFAPLSFVFLVAAWWAAGAERRKASQALTGLLSFVLIAGPFVLALSHAKHRLTLGDTGRFAFFIFMDRIEQPAFWQGENGTGVPKHPTRQLLTEPRLYEFGTPFHASYPPYYDMSYWMEGGQTHFRLSSLIAIFRQSSGTFFQIWDRQSMFVVALVVLIACVGWREYCASLAKLAYLWIPSLLACAAYFLVLTEWRYVAPFILVLWTSAFAGISLDHLAGSRRMVAGLALAVCVVIGTTVAKAAVSELQAGRIQENTDWDVASGLRNLGVLPGEKLGAIAAMGNAHWARLSGTQIVAEIPLGDDFKFWSADGDRRRRVIETFARTGAHVIVAKAPPLCATSLGWIQLPRTDYYVYVIR